MARIHGLLNGNAELGRGADPVGDTLSPLYSEGARASPPSQGLR
jgi:hypothetical protein